MAELQNPKKITRLEAIHMLASNNYIEICSALISITYYDPDWHWCQDQCLKYLNHENKNVSGLAATCLGHIARLHKNLEKEKVIKELKKYLNDADISGQVQDALDDIDIFIPSR